MKRAIPLFITAAGGFVLIIAFFIPATEGWGEVAAIWFDILAAIAFVLGGGNLLKIHLKKISDRARGWGYSAVTIIAFLATLYFGFLKTGSHPTPKQEHYGEIFVPMTLEEFPENITASVAGKLPQKGNGKKLPPSVSGLLSEKDGLLHFRGWMLPNQKSDLLKYEDTLEWRCAVETLFQKAQPPKTLRGKITYYADHRALAFRGRMTAAQKDALLKLAPQNARWKEAVEQLERESNRKHSISLDQLPPGVRIPKSLQDVVTFDAAAKQLSIIGPMSTAQRDKLAMASFPLARPLRGEKRRQFYRELEQHGAPLSAAQRAEADKLLNSGWTVEQLIKTLDAAGEVPEVNKTACEMLAEKKAGAKQIGLKKKVGRKVALNDAQKALLKQFADDETMTVESLSAALKNAGPWEDRQGEELEKFFSRVPTAALRNARLAVALLRVGPLSEKQREFLVADYRRQQQWRQTVGELFLAAHTVKYPWSGDYRETGTPFWWMYEYAFKPLTATMFAMLAFYVASAAFRAFRAKNFEAFLLLATAFIILLGRTFAGVLLTDWIPENSGVGGFRIENLTVYIMSVFNTAGNRSIMIGVALGIASTSLKVLLGVDRSYLGSQEE